MPVLRDLLFGYEQGSALVPQDFTVWNTNVQTASNGGVCCLWTVPAGVTYAVFEMWSAGGTGAMGCCCMMAGGAGSGGYAIKACTVAAGQQIRICAAGSGCCTSNTSGEQGCATYVCSLGGGGQGTWLSCMNGGIGGYPSSTCNYYYGCYHCCSMCSCCNGISNNAEFNVPGNSGTIHPTQYCADEGHHFAANAAFAAPGPRIGPNGCCAWGGDQGFGTFPGGGGLSTQAYGGGCCYGSPGGGGMVYVIYY